MGTNRAKIALQNWEEQHRELIAIMGSDENHMINREKFLFYRSAIARLSFKPSEEERIYSRIMRGTLKRLRKEMIPNIVLRKISEWIDNYLIVPKMTNEYVERIGQNQSAILSQLEAIGIATDPASLSEKLNYENKEVEVALMASFHQEAVVQIVLRFGKSADEGYILKSIGAKLESKDNLLRECSVKAADQLHIQQVIQLLKGSAVCRDLPDAIAGERWIQLDLSKCDQYGNHPLIETLLKPESSIEKNISSIVRDLGISGLKPAQVLSSLKNGLPFIINDRHGQQVLIEAKPGSSNVVFRDGNNVEISAKDVKSRLELTGNSAISNSMSGALKSKGKTYSQETPVGLYR